MMGEITDVSLEKIVAEAAYLKVTGYRLVTLTCLSDGGSGFEILYHFDKDFALRHLRLTAAGGVPVPSISAIYLAAFLAENEIQDLFGVRFTNLAVDYRRTLYLNGEDTPPPHADVVAPGVSITVSGGDAP